MAGEAHGSDGSGRFEVRIRRQGNTPISNRGITVFFGFRIRNKKGIGMPNLDYITLTSPTDRRDEIIIPEGYISQSLMQWQAGPALYSGYAYRYANGTLQILFSPEQGFLLRCSGSLCEDVAERIPDIGTFKCTRLDLCIDVPTSIPVEDWYLSQKSKGPKIHSTNINNETLYIGSRKSMRFWRIYNKALEQGLDGDLFRIEVELKGVRANQVKHCIRDKSLRWTFFRESTIGVVGDIIDSVLGDEYDVGYEPLDLALPRGKPHGKRFLRNVVVPFLKSNAWAVDELRREGVIE